MLDAADTPAVQEGATPGASEQPADAEFGAGPVAETTAPPAAAAVVTPAFTTPPAVTQNLIDAVTQLEASRRDISATGFQRRLHLAYAVADQASKMVQEIERQHARLLSELMSVERRQPLPMSPQGQL